MINERTELLFNVLAKTGIYPNKGNLAFLLRRLFQGIELNNARILDIGGGSGIISFYAACRGAKEVICLEPSSDGSSTGVNDKFLQIQSHMNFENVTLLDESFQVFTTNEESFDIIVLYNSINHLDEDACIHLQNSAIARNRYLELFHKMFTLCRNGSYLIIADCSNKNIFPHIGLRNPFMPSIEWHKHQEPETWIRILRKIGFVNPKISWSTFNRLRLPGVYILGNKFMAYLLLSHFSLRMQKR